MLGGDVADEFLDDDGLAHAGAAEQTDLAALGEGADEVDGLDPGLKQPDARVLFRQRRRLAVNGVALVAY